MDWFAIRTLRACSWIYLALSVVLGFAYFWTALKADLTGSPLYANSAIAGAIITLFIFGQGILVWALLRVLAYLGDSVSWLVDRAVDQQEQEEWEANQEYAPVRPTAQVRRTRVPVDRG